MSLTLPSIVPTGYAGDYSDFFRTKADKSGAVREITGAVVIPTTIAAGTLVGLFPFNASFKLGYGTVLNAGAMGTGVTGSLGIQYYNSTTGTSNTACYLSAVTATALGGFINLSGQGAQVTGMTLDTLGDGWVVFVVGTTSTTTSSTLTFNAPFAYDASGITN